MSFTTRQNQYLSIVGRDNNPLTLDVGGSYAATEPIRLNPDATHPTKVWFEPVSSAGSRQNRGPRPTVDASSADVRVLFPNAGGRGLFVGDGDRLELHPTSGVAPADQSRFQFRVEPAIDRPGCARLKSLFGGGYVKHADAKSRTFPGLVSNQKDV